MACSFDNPNFPEYYKEIISFLGENRYIFEYQNTHILSNKVFDCIPRDWKDFFLKYSFEALNEIAAGKINNLMPETLKDFILKALRFKPIYGVTECPTLNIEQITGVGSKKMHEITKIAPVIDKVCCENNVEYIVDIGCGVGHLSEFLHKQYGYHVVGLEGNDTLVDTAFKNKKMESKVCYKNLHISENSSNDIASTLVASFKNFDVTKDKVCLIALHGCADLSVDILRIFGKIPFLKCMIVMPCCYHRMQQIGDGYLNFPLYYELKEDERGFLNQAFLRLACQRSNSSWVGRSEKEHELNARNCLFRNILQEVVDKENVDISRKTRKPGLKETNFQIDDFVEKLPSAYCFSKQGQILEETDDLLLQIKEKVKSRYLDIYGVQGKRLMEGLISLQMLLQPVFEGFVLMDRCAYVTKTLGYLCNVVKVTNDQLSPRCFAMKITKH